ncbi:C4-type zinc ribbon domain-containing protein [Tissierella praeacuta]|uniref:zinc ribbon domain-containing protein n=1 Tax=Tissierella praeacuta TaxID=43131 RepID=UPI0033424785
MEQLDLLRNLEERHNSLNLYQKELLNLKNNLTINKTEEKIAYTEGKFIKLKSNQKKIEEKLKESNLRLNDYNLKIKEIEKSLYNGQIGDLKQLEYLSSENSKLKEIIDVTETEVLGFMNEVEDMNNELLEMEKALDDIKDKSNKLKGQYKITREDLESKIHLEEKEISTLENKIDLSLLNKYNTIRKSKKTGIAEVKDSICSGCNMLIPIALMDKLNSQSEIIRCENCGRILCKS